MSGGARDFAYRHSPYTGAVFAVHCALADVANDLHHHELWFSMTTLGRKARVSRGTANAAVLRLAEDGFLELLDPPTFGTKAGGTRGGGTPAKYRFLMPDVPVVFDYRMGARSDDSKPLGARSETFGCAIHEPLDARPARTNQKDQPKEPKGERRKRRGTPCPDPFTLNPEDREWATENTPSIDVTMSTKQFVSFWRGDGRLKVNWKQTWRNWLLKDEERHHGATQRSATRTYL